MQLHLPSLLVVLLLGSGIVGAQTIQQTSGPPGAAFGGVVEHDGVVVAAGRSAGIFLRSGGEWSAVPVNTRVGRLYSVNGILFGSVTSGLYRSEDGVSWESLFENMIVDASFGADSALVLTSDSLFISADGTEWWSVLSGRDIVDENEEPTGDLLMFLSASVQTPDGRFWVIAFTTVGSGIFVSSDGAAWRNASEGLPEFVFPNQLFASAAGSLIAEVNGIVYEFDSDSGMWEERSNGLPEFSANHFLEVDGDVYILARTSTSASLHRLDGESWVPVSLPEANIVEVAPSEDGLFAISPGGLYEKVGEGAWTPLHDGVVATSAEPYRLGSSVVANTSTGWMRSDDGGEMWESVVFPGDVNRIFDLGTVVIGTTPDGVYRSTDGGDTWQAANTGLNVGPFHKRNFRDVVAHNGTIYGGLYSSRAIVHQGAEVVGGVYRSLNNGQSWSFVGGNFPTNSHNFPAGVYRLVSTDSHLIASTQEGLVRIPHTGGSWEELNSPVTASVLGFGTDGDRVVLITYNESYLSEDNGVTWEPFTNGLPEGSYRRDVTVHNGEIHLLVYPLLDTVSGLFTVGENSWVNTGVELPEWMLWNSMASVDEHLYLGSFNHGIWRVDTGTTTDAAPPEIVTEQTDIVGVPESGSTKGNSFPDVAVIIRRSH